MPKLKGKKAIAAFLLKNIGKKVTTKQIYEVSGQQAQCTRRLRELRDDDGWNIESINDAADLKADEYRLAEQPPENPPRFSRRISKRLRAEVLHRNGLACVWCGKEANEIDPDTGRKVRLHIGHIVAKQHGGKDELGNLRTLCSMCNQGAKHFTPEPPSWSRLLGLLRTATVDDQKKALEWLNKKFEKKK